MGIEGHTVVREQQGPQRLPQRDDSSVVGRRASGAGVEQVVPDEPGHRRLRIGQLVSPGLHVEGVDELRERAPAVPGRVGERP